MSLFIIGIPLVLVAIGIAVVPLIAMSKKEVHHLMYAAERRLEAHRLVQQAHHHVRHASAAAPADEAPFMLRPAGTVCATGTGPSSSRAPDRQICGLPGPSPRTSARVPPSPDVRRRREPPPLCSLGPSGSPRTDTRP